MPSELGCAELPDGMISFKKTAQDRIKSLDPECTTEEDDIDDDDDGDDDDDDDDFDEELEFAYQCDFQKKRPNKPCSKTSLLSNLLSTSAGAATATTTTEQCNNISRPKPINLQKSMSVPIPSVAYSNSTTATSDPLSESLKRNLEWEDCQNLLKKYQQNRKASNHDVSWTDNFSKW